MPPYAVRDPGRLAAVAAPVTMIVLAIQKNPPSVTAEPNATWGGRAIAQPTGRLSLSVGAYSSDNTLNQATASGTEFRISGSAGSFVIGEAAYSLNAEKGATGLPGRASVGNALVMGAPLAAEL